MISRFEQYNESIRDKMTPVPPEEIKRLWKDKFRISYDEYEKTMEELTELGVDFTPKEAEISFRVKGYTVFDNDWQIGKTLTEDDAKFLIEQHRKVSYTVDRLRYKEDGIYLEYDEARIYISKKKYNIKTYKNSGGEKSVLR